MLTLTLLTYVQIRCMVFTCGEEIENITGFFVKHFVSNEDYINYYSFTWYVSARVFFFPSQYFIELAIGLRKSNNMRRHESEGKPV